MALGLRAMICRNRGAVPVGERIGKKHLGLDGPGWIRCGFDAEDFLHLMGNGRHPMLLIEVIGAE
jgi:hypothetical protein